MSRTRRLILASLVLLPLATGAFALQQRAQNQNSRLLGQVMSLVSDKFVDSVATDSLYEKAARGLVAELKDPYAELYSPKQLEAFNTTVGGFYGGLGMLIEPLDEYVVVSRVYPNTPASEAGIRSGDRIVGIDSVSTRGWKNEQITSRLRGQPGTKVTAEFARPGVAQPLRVQFTRRVIRIPAVPYAIMLDRKTGYIPMQSFNETAAQEVAAALQHLLSQGAKGVVLDLRGNGGGFLDPSLAVSNLFLSKGKEIVSVRGRGVPTETYLTENAPVAPDIPLVILTDGYTASASEIVAGALQDHDRAVILGTTSFGKGLVQGMYRLDGGYALKLTTSKWYTPSGRSIQKERKLNDAGVLVEVHPDSLETDSARRARPVYKSDGGRVVYGGGAITPDIFVPNDTLTTAEYKLARALAAKPQESSIAVDEYALEMKSKVPPDFTVTPQMRDELYRRLQKRGASIDRKTYDDGPGYADRILGSRIATLAFGDSTAKRRDLPEDTQLRKALELLDRAATMKELLALAPSATAPVRQAKKPEG
jgi:carboxyl-terminal processing protease